MTRLRDILVPISLLREPDRFGGVRRGDCLRGDLVIADELPQRLEPAERTATPRMLLPALTEAHCHLDKCYSGDRLGTIGGDLAQAIEAQLQDKQNWTEDDLRRRMSRGLGDLVDAGCRAVRSHTDWGDDAAPPLAWSVLAELAQEHAHLTIQTAALMGIDKMTDPAFCFSMAAHIARMPGGVLGAFVLHHDKRHEGLSNLFAAAEHFGLPLDFHVDEGLGHYNGLELICDVALETGFDGPILCGHAVSLIDRDADAVARITDKLLRAGITVCALPTTNLYLQGRREGTPDRRGLTRLCELHAAGVPVVLGSDNVADAFCPMGRHDPLSALHLAALAAHLDPPMGDWLPAITVNAAKALGLEPGHIETCPSNHLRLCAVGSTADLVAGRAPLVPLLSDREVMTP